MFYGRQAGSRVCASCGGCRWLGETVLIIVCGILCSGWDMVVFGQVLSRTAQEDRQLMLERLGITKMRAGFSADPSAPNHANYDEERAGPFSPLPPLLVCEDGSMVTTKEEWWERRRPEIIRLLEKEVYGCVPDNVPGVSWRVVSEQELTVGEIAVRQWLVEGTADNSRYPEVEVKIPLVVGVPVAPGPPVPVLMMFSPFVGGQPPGGAGRFRPPGPLRQEIVVRAGWGYALLNPNTVQPDNGAGLSRGIIGLTNQGRPRDPEQWGALRAWAWGASRALDFLETLPEVDAGRVAIEGVSRYGKAALVTMAFDTRFAAALVGSAGAGGVKLFRRNFGEAVENLAGTGEYHWMAGNFLKYAAEESVFGRKTADDLPVDTHQLLALCAPRLVFISYGVPERGDALWLDQRGSFMAAVAAQPAWHLYGDVGLGLPAGELRQPMPAVNNGLLEGRLAWRQHDGGHTTYPNLPVFLQWANRHFAGAALPTTH
ncbi:MAG: hypothetical protein KatS3mg110_0407 [Pirellulaceae bacterium]|nr:MAG: hypothetical protein KatS3mg110_0407 [Pirellulaceae bacterium]